MNHLQIVDISFCKVVPEEETEIIGGLGCTEDLAYWYRRLFPELVNIFRPSLEDYETTKVYYEPGTVVNKLENTETGLSGYEVSSHDSQSSFHSVVLSGSNWIQAFSSVVSNS